MTEVWTTSVAESTLDEAPMVYKPMDEIIKNTKKQLILNILLNRFIILKRTRRE